MISREEAIKEIKLRVLDIRTTLHDIQKINMPKEVFDRLNELDEKLYELNQMGKQ